MRRFTPCLLPLLVVFCAGWASANPHFFPRLRPLFPGLDEARVPSSAKLALAQAKVDFQLLNQGAEPRHAKFAGRLPYSRSQVYNGQGYRLTFVREQSVYPHRVGAEIVIFAELTGGKEYCYREIDETF